MESHEQFSILLVDDDLTVVRVLNRILCNFSSVRFANSGRTALKLARDSTPDLVLMDVDMPEFSGFEVCIGAKRAGERQAMVIDVGSKDSASPTANRS